MLVIDEEVQEFVFTDVEEKPIPSLLRGFSAPVRLNYDYSRFDLCALISRDEDEFVRWDASQQLAIQIINEVELAMQQDLPVSIDPIILEAWRNLLKDDTLDPAIIAAMVRLPSEVYLGELASQKSGINVDSIRKSRELVRRYLAQALEEEWVTQMGAYMNMNTAFIDRENEIVVIVDPFDSVRWTDALAQEGLNPTHLLYTHKTP